MCQIQLKGVVKEFGKTTIIQGVDLDIHDREFIVFVGPSGCGKSTLLRLIAGLEESSKGQIFIDKEDVTYLPPAKRGVAMVFQSYALYPHMTVFENMAFGLSLAKEEKLNIQQKVESVADILQISHLLNHLPKQLSGGQRQRVAIGRAIVRNPKVFLFDEPLSNLDASLRGKTRIEIAKLHKSLKSTMIYVTHDQVEAMTLADRIVVLNAGQIEQVGTPMELYHHPRNKFVAGFIGSPKMNFIKAWVDQYLQDGVMLRFAGAQKSFYFPYKVINAPKDAVSVGIRPEHLSLCLPQEEDVTNHGGFLNGKIVLIERMGSEVYVHVSLTNDEVITVRSTEASGWSLGQSVLVKWNAHQTHVFNDKIRCQPMSTRQGFENLGVSSSAQAVP